MSSSSRASSGQLHLLYVRHGETQDNIDRILQGLRNTSLTEKGHKEARVMAEKLRGYNVHIDAIYHSPLTRIVQTIQPVLSDQPGIPTYPDADLVGQALGELEGGSYDSIDMGNPRSADGGPGVELFDDFVRRHKRAFARMVGKEAPLVGREDRTVLIATHGVGTTSLFKALEASYPDFNPKLAMRGPQAFEVRWPDSDDIAKLVVVQPAQLPIQDGSLDWAKVCGQPFLIERWGKKEKALA